MEASSAWVSPGPEGLSCLLHRWGNPFNIRHYVVILLALAAVLSVTYVSISDSLVL